MQSIKNILNVFILTTTALLSTETVYAARIDGNYSNPTDLKPYIDFTNSALTVLNTNTGYLEIKKPDGAHTCGGVAVSPTWLVTSAHCMTDATSVVYVSNNTIASGVATVINSNYDSTSFFQKGCFNFPCSNAPRGAKDDIAMIKLNQSVTNDSLKLPNTAPTAPFVSQFVGWGFQGDGQTDLISIPGVSQLHTILGTLTTSMTVAEQQAVFLKGYKQGALGGQNTKQLISNSFLSSDFDDVRTGITRSATNTDFLPGVTLEAAPAPGDSGSGIFDSETGALIGLVSGGGYGNRASLQRSYSPGAYGSLDFGTPIYLHSTWIDNIVNSNLTLNPKVYIPSGTSVSLVFGDVQFGFSSQFQIPDFVFSNELQILPDTFSHDTITTVSEPTTVPEPFTIVGTLIGGTAAFRMRKKLKAIAE